MSARARAPGGGEALDAAARWARTKRRIAGGLYLVLLGLCALGVRGTWWQVYAGERPVGDPMTGPEYLRWVEVRDVPEDPDAVPYQRFVRENSWRPANLALLGCAVAFFFASFCLVTDARLWWPVLAATLLVLACGLYALYDVTTRQEVFRDVLELELRRELAAGEHPAGGGADIAPVATAQPTVRAPRLRLAWGLSLFIAASVVMLIDSVYLVLPARPSAEKT